MFSHLRSSTSQANDHFDDNVGLIHADKGMMTPAYDDSLRKYVSQGFLFDDGTMRFVIHLHAFVSPTTQTISCRRSPFSYIVLFSNFRLLRGGIVVMAKTIHRRATHA